MKSSLFLVVKENVFWPSLKASGEMKVNQPRLLHTDLLNFNYLLDVFMSFIWFDKHKFFKRENTILSSGQYLGLKTGSKT